MGLISNIEEKLENWVEKPFQEKNDQGPLLIEIAVRRQLLRQQKDILGKIMVPNDLEIILSQKLFEIYEPFFAELGTDLKKTLKEWLKDNSFEMAGPIQLNFRKGTGEVEMVSVFANFSSEEGKQGKEDEISEKMPGMNDRSNNGVPGKKILGELIVTNTGQRFKVFEADTIIGRDPDCDIRLEDPAVSRIHAAVTRQYGKFILEDLGSKSGTRINHIKINRGPLKDGDSILIGETDLVFKRNI